MGIRAAFEFERRLSGVSRRFSQWSVRPNGEEQDREPRRRRCVENRPGAGDVRSGRDSGEPEKDFKSEIGTVETEKALNLTPANKRKSSDD